MPSPWDSGACWWWGWQARGHIHWRWRRLRWERHDGDWLNPPRGSDPRDFMEKERCQQNTIKDLFMYICICSPHIHADLHIYVNKSIFMLLRWSVYVATQGLKSLFRDCSTWACCPSSPQIPVPGCGCRCQEPSSPGSNNKLQSPGQLPALISKQQVFNVFKKQWSRHCRKRQTFLYRMTARSNV